MGTRATFQRILIVCEGSETEPNYFNACKTAFRATLRDLVVRGLGKDPRTVARKAEKIRDQEEAKSGGPFDEVWCVFDYDNFGPVFYEAIKEAKSRGFEVAYSNPSVELWFCLHFRKVEEPVTNDQLKAWLTTHLKRPYEKSDDDLFGILWPNHEQAQERAAQLVERHGNKSGGLDAGAANPITRVHELMQTLQRNSRR